MPDTDDPIGTRIATTSFPAESVAGKDDALARKDALPVAAGISARAGH
jgi:hypothetical protein